MKPVEELCRAETVGLVRAIVSRGDDKMIVPVVMTTPDRRIRGRPHGRPCDAVEDDD
jgi:hypothetical protein